MKKEEEEAMSFCSLSRRLPLLHALPSSNCDMEEDDEDRERLVSVVTRRTLFYYTLLPLTKILICPILKLIFFSIFFQSRNVVKDSITLNESV